MLSLMNQDQLFLVFNIVVWLLGTIVSLWILWAIIRGAVLSALRKHSQEQREVTNSMR
ncbi:hypothetical protein EDF62_0303 [Leucobacter luti]|uniref:Uncharacterized protein n=2 Tax=Leucobacter luti TaxID=340320 RepID=A0A4R6S705_9MICO|nr:hypothetical protein EDF62_0303 [Leucobacter luti]